MAPALSLTPTVHTSIGRTTSYAEEVHEKLFAVSGKGEANEIAEFSGRYYTGTQSVAYQPPQCGPCVSDRRVVLLYSDAFPDACIGAVRGLVQRQPAAGGGAGVDQQPDYHAPDFLLQLQTGGLDAEQATAGF